jgi:hypothetical protein
VSMTSAGGITPPSSTLATVQSLKRAAGKGKTRSWLAAGYSFSAQSLILLVTTLWASAVDERFFAGDAVVYYTLLQDGSWSTLYFFEPTLFLILHIVSPSTFSSYIFWSGAIALTILLYAFYRLGYSRSEQVLLILFFSCSYYGLHFLLDFQRQFYAFVFFVLAVSLSKASPLAWVASLFSHAYGFSLFLFWAVRRLTVIASLAAVTLAAPIIYYLTLTFIDEQRLLKYAANAEPQLMIKEPLNLLYAAIVIFTTRKGYNQVRTLSWLFIALSVPTLFWPGYGGLFVRFDYYFFPALIALWPTCLNPKRRHIFEAVMIGSTLLGFALWIRMNLGVFFSAVDLSSR